MPLFDQIAFVGHEKPTVYEEVSNPDPQLHEDLTFRKMGDQQQRPPDWLAPFMEAQTQSYNQMAAALNKCQTHLKV